MATNWSFHSAASNQFESATNTVSGTVVPNTGELLAVGGWGGTSATNYTSYTLSDTGSGGWSSIGSFLTSSDPAGKWAAQSWWKIATAADHNGGSGFTITLTGNGGTGPTSTRFEVDAFSLGAGLVVAGIDAFGATIDAPNSAVNTYTLSGSVGSSVPSNLDELVWGFLAVDTPPGGGPWSCTWQGTTPASPTAMTSTGFSVDSDMHGFYSLGVQASATAATNQWVASWGFNRLPALAGGTFYYKTNQGNMFLVL